VLLDQRFILRRSSPLKLESRVIVQRATIDALKMHKLLLVVVNILL